MTQLKFKFKWSHFLKSPTYMAAIDAKVWLVMGGKTGWIGQQLVAMLQKQGETAVVAESRLESREALAAELDRVQPTHVLNAAGVTGRPNVDWCESHREETIRTNVVGEFGREGGRGGGEGGTRIAPRIWSPLLWRVGRPSVLTSPTAHRIAPSKRCALCRKTAAAQL